MTSLLYKDMKRAVAGLIAVLASGAMLVLALPPSNVWILGWFALVPVFWATRETRLSVGVVAGIAATMFAAFLSTNGYLYRSGSAEGNSTWTYVGLALFGFVFAIVAGIAAEVKRPSLKSILVVACAGVLVDCCLLAVIPASLAISQSTVRPMLVLASFTGVWGIGFLIWFFNLAVSEVIAKNRTLIPGIASIPVIFTLMFTINLTHSKTVPRLLVGVVQSDSNELAKMRELSIEAVERQSARLGRPFVVWPEFGGLYFTSRGETKKLTKLASDPLMPAFVTTYQDGFKPLPHNTATLFSSSGESKSYFKRKLFGAESTMHTPGTKPVAVAWGDSLIGLNICFDSCYPSIIRDTARLGADIIALPTIDPESPYSFFAANHAAFTAIRAAENGVSIVRADGNAYSAIVDSDGEVIGATNDGKDQVAYGLVSRYGRPTFYRWAGDWFPFACGGVLIWALLTNIRSKRAAKESASK